MQESSQKATSYWQSVSLVGKVGLAGNRSYQCPNSSRRSAAKVSQCTVMALFFNCVTLRQYILSRVEQFKDSSQVSPIFFQVREDHHFHTWLRTSWSAELLHLPHLAMEWGREDGQPGERRKIEYQPGGRGHKYLHCKWYYFCLLFVRNRGFG